MGWRLADVTLSYDKTAIRLGFRHGEDKNESHFTQACKYEHLETHLMPLSLRLRVSRVK